MDQTKTHDDMAGSTPSTRLNFICELELKMQKLWHEHSVYDANMKNGKEKYFCTFPYPYMNGLLHIGHAYTVTKAEFQARFQRLLDKNVLWPFAFHGTGMPIPACADKLRCEIEDELMERDREKVVHVEEPEKVYICPITNQKFYSSRSKAASKIPKTETIKPQWNILKSCGVNEDEIPLFQDAQHWLDYFPKAAKKDLSRFGVAVDWRRSFITTDRNPYYDAFVRWQFNLLHQRKYIHFGTRACIFSPKTQQPCTDHDRICGENVMPQEYTLIKLKLEQLPKDFPSEFCKTPTVFLMATTLRPEAMYGQTNCFVRPLGMYGVYLALNKPLVKTSTTKGVLSCYLSPEEAYETLYTFYICSEPSAWNMAHQGLIPINSKTLRPFLLWLYPGFKLVGLPVTAPLSIYTTVYILPMSNLLMDKGTGIVASVPSDSPDDFVALRDLQENLGLRQEFNIQDFMVQRAPVEIIDVPGLGRTSAVELCLKHQVNSQNDRANLAKAKEEAYRKSYYEGTMIIGDYKGEKVCVARPKILHDLITNNQAVVYYEPESTVGSRTGDACVVALCDQWYFDYANIEWKNMVMQYITQSNNFKTYPSQCLNQILHVVSWLKEWACSRHYGLGTYLPWDKAQKIESLSDSTIYMAYYTISHFLQKDIYGSIAGEFNILPEQLTDDVFNYIFMQTDQLPLHSTISKEILLKFREEFEYWYPMDLRVSGKDLIFNHLTMSLFIHAAIWPLLQNKTWPKAIACNGHSLINAKKMSKSLGNFLTLKEAIECFSADATRIALADAGDTLDDANFQKDTAVSGLMRIYNFCQFVKNYVSNKINLRESTCEYTWVDHVFYNEIIGLTQKAHDHYTCLQYRDALRFGFYDFTTIKDHYKLMCGEELLMHSKLIRLWIQTQCVILCPIAPHVCEYVWTELLSCSSTFVVNEAWPQFDLEYKPLLHQQYVTLSTSLEEFRRVYEKSRCSKKQDMKSASAVIYIAKEYLPWQQLILKVLQTLPLNHTGTAPLDTSYMNYIFNHPEFKKAADKKRTNEALSFANYRIKNDLPYRGPNAFDLTVPYDEEIFYNKNKECIKRVLQIKSLEIRKATDDAHPRDETERKNLALPFKPSIFFFL